jgi:hypothetical protein
MTSKKEVGIFAIEKVGSFWWVCKCDFHSVSSGRWGQVVPICNVDR